MIDLVEIMKGIRTVEIAKADGLDTEVYILDCEDELILVDVGFTPQCHKTIQAELDEMGKTWDEIKMIIITHAHGDHIENLPQVRKLTGAEIAIGKGDEAKLHERTGVKADIILEHGDLIGACGGIETVHIPGHSKGNLCLYLIKHKALIAGDTIFGDSEGNLEAPPEKYCEDVVEATDNLSILADYDFDKLLLSHGKNTMNYAKEKVLTLIEACN